MADLRFMGYETYTIFGAHFKKGKQNYEYRIKYLLNIYLEWEKKSRQISNLKTADKYHKHHKIRKSNINFIN